MYFLTLNIFYGKSEIRKRLHLVLEHNEVTEGKRHNILKQ
jgi:hypothetical protein